MYDVCNVYDVYVTLVKIITQFYSWSYQEEDIRRSSWRYRPRKMGLSLKSFPGDSSSVHQYPKLLREFLGPIKA